MYGGLKTLPKEIPAQNHLMILGRHLLMAGLRIPIQFLEERTLPPFFESKCPFFIYIIFHFFHSHHL